MHTCNHPSHRKRHHRNRARERVALTHARTHTVACTLLGEGSDRIILSIVQFKPLRDRAIEMHRLFSAVGIPTLGLQLDKFVQRYSVAAVRALQVVKAV